MFKIFVRSIVYSSVLKRNLELYVKAIISQRTRSYSRPKRIKKMFRTWEFTNEANEYQQEIQKQQSSQCKQKPQQIPQRQYRLVSYNILAQDLLTEHLYLYYGIDTQFLRWEHRLHCLQNELNYVNADILCIQEMQFNHLKEFVALLSENRKMEYVYKKKTGHRTDGCAIIYDGDLFQLIDQKDLEFFQPSVNSKLNRENIAVFAKFKLNHEPEKQIVIGTTHLLFNPRRHDVRVAQAELLLKNLQDFAQKCDTNSKNPYLLVILTGDMNSEPNSPPFRMLTSSVEQRRQSAASPYVLNEENCDSEAKTTNDLVVPSFEMKAINFGNNSASTYHNRWITVDYILRSIQRTQKYDEHSEEMYKSEVKVLSLYKLPAVNSCELFGKIPNQILGSDHYLQAIEFLIV